MPTARTNDAAIRTILAKVELLSPQAADFVWTEAHAQFRADKANGRKTDVLSYFENALDLLEGFNAFCHRHADFIEKGMNGPDCED